MPAVHAIEAELVPGRQLLRPRADVGHPLRVLVGQLVRLGEALPAGHLDVLVAHDLVGAPVELDRRRVAPDLRAALAEHLEQLRDLVGEDVEVELVAVARGEAERVVLAVTADEQLDPGRAGRRAGCSSGSSTRAYLPSNEKPGSSCRVARQMISKCSDSHSIRSLRPGYSWPYCGGLVLLEPGAQAEGQAAAADGVERRGRLGGDGRVVEGRVQDDHADPDPRHERREAGRQRPAVEGDRLAGPLGERRARRSRSDSKPSFSAVWASSTMRAQARPGSQPSNSLK